MGSDAKPILSDARRILWLKFVALAETAFSGEVDRFIDKELSKGALLGQFEKPPFAPWTQVSPLMIAWVIIDLSFLGGGSVNDSVALDFFQGCETSYTLPTVHDLAQRGIALDPGRLLWKTDLEQAYRQLRSDPLVRG